MLGVLVPTLLSVVCLDTLLTYEVWELDLYFHFVDEG